jgi:hypothetical protein
MVIMFVTALLVFTRAIQQQNVIGGHYVLAAITPFVIASAEVATVLIVVETGWSAIPWVGTGGAIGVTSAMFLHKKYIRRR